MVCVCPTMPKRGAVTSTTRRSRSSLCPVISPCTGAAKPSAATSPGTSGTRPSVMKMAPATRSWGTSESAEDSAVNKRVPSVSPSAGRASTSRPSMPAMRPSRSASAARTASVCCKRSPNSWLGLLSMTTAATEVSGSRSSRVIDGLASASTNSASASVRTKAARVRANTSRSEIANATATAAHTTEAGTRGANEIPRFNLRPHKSSSGPRGSRDASLSRRSSPRGSKFPLILRSAHRSRVYPRSAFQRASRVNPTCVGASRRMRPASLSQPFEQRRNVDLVGLVVAGERVHHDVDAGAEREFALARLGGDEREHGLAVLAHRPGAGEIVRRDDDRRYAVAGARRTARRLVVVNGRQRFHPQLAGAEAAGKVLQEIECLRQHVVAPHRLELGNIERGENGAQRLHARTAGFAAGAGGRLDSVAGVEQDGAALLHVGVDVFERLAARL